MCASIPLRSPGTRQRASLPFGTGFFTSGSRIAANANNPEIAASRRLIVVAAYWSIRRPDSRTTFGPGRPGTFASRQDRRNRNSTSVVTSGSGCPSATSHRQNASKSYP